MQLSDIEVKLYVIIVLYKENPLQSITYLSLTRAVSEASGKRLSCRVLLYDNTPGAGRGDDLPENVEYFASSANRGLSDAYNIAVSNGSHSGFDWLLTLDQDTELPPSFISDMVDIAAVCTPNSEVAAIVPHIRAGDRDVSPNWFAGGMLPRWFPRNYDGVPVNAVYAFNSGTMVRIRAVEAIGGYSPLFWLDNSDAYLFRQIEKKKWKVYVAGKVQLKHDFSMLDISNKMSLLRYKNAVDAGSAFFDIEMNRLAGMEHTLRLLRRYLKQLVLRENIAVRKITASALIRRLVVPKQRRVEAWMEEQKQRIASYTSKNEGKGGLPS